MGMEVKMPQLDWRCDILAGVKRHVRTLFFAGPAVVLGELWIKAFRYD
jgi:hypothetical protein